jgi:threonine synthase
MKLYSTNNRTVEISLKEAVFKGLPDDNGLFMPVSIPRLDDSFFQNIDKLSFREIAFEVSKALIGDDVPSNELKKIIDDVITFDAPVVKLHDNMYLSYFMALRWLLKILAPASWPG